MPKRRSTVTMTKAEVQQMLRTTRDLQVTSIGLNGWPHMVTMWFAVDDDGVIEFSTYTKSQKVLNLQRDPRITVLVADGTVYSELRGVSIEGTAEVVTDPQQVADGMARVGRKNGDGSGPPGQVMSANGGHAPITPQATKRSLIRVHPQRVRTWDHTKLPAGVH
ncbi:MAG: hypothetical protein EXR65_03350 [Dehalococcoidia bacterium]|nr:hypothetical protein [Dehalococcoidia bacterium]